MENLKEKIEEIKKELQKLIDEVNKEEKWQDKLVQPKSSRYHYIRSDVFSGFNIESECGTRRKPEHAFKTIEQAELVKEKMLLMQEMLAFAHVKNEGWEADWNDERYKHGLVFYEGLKVNKYTNFNWFIFGVAVKSIEIAQEMKDVFGERIEKFYNKQY